MTAAGGTGTAGYTSSWTNGTIAAGGSQGVTIRFSPTEAKFYSNVLTIAGDQTSGGNQINVSGTGTGGTTTSTPASSTVTLTGTVTDGTSGGILPGILVQITDGVNGGMSVKTTSNGTYTLPGVTPGSFTMQLTATSYIPQSQSVTVTAANPRANFVLQRVAPAPVATPAPAPAPAPGTLWTVSGTGDNVFSMPTSVVRVHITGRYTGFTSNFIVFLNGRLLVNELLGVGWGTLVYDGVVLGGGGLVQIQYSNGVSWSLTQVP
jgi:hypothetical protein